MPLKIQNGICHANQRPESMLAQRMYTNAPPETTRRRKANAGYTLAETVIAVAILSFVSAGFIYGYVETTNRARWSSMSLTAQSLALESMERARAAKWCVYS